MTARNVQRRENQDIRRIFKQAGDLRKVMLGGIDYAKSDHRIAVCADSGSSHSRASGDANHLAEKKEIAALASNVTNAKL